MRKRALILGTAAVLAAALMGGCSGGTEEDTQKEETKSATQAQEKGADASTLRFVTYWEEGTFDPALWGDGGGCKVGISMYETLLKFNDDRTLAPSLAESWEVSDDQKTYTFHLRKGVQFHRGYGEFTSEDVAYTLERLSDPEVGATDVKSRCKVDNIESMDTSDPYTFVVHLKEPDTELFLDFASWYTNIISKKAYEELGPSGFGANPVGTGPYEYEQGKPSESYTVKKFEDYWGEPGILDRVEVTTLTEESSSLNAFDADEVDMIALNSSNSIQKYRNSEDARVEVGVGVGCYYLGMNNEKAPFDNPKVREAVKYAINYDEMLEDYWQGELLPPSGYMQAFCLYAAPVEETGFTYEYNPEKAKELLAEAGYPNGFSVKVVAPNDSVSKGPLMVVQQYLSAVGINAELELSEFATFIDQVRNGQDDMWFLINGDGYRGDQWMTSFMSEKIPGSNWNRYVNPEFDALMKKGFAAMDQEEKSKYFLEAQKLLIQDIPSVPIAESTTDYAVKNRVKNFSLNVEGLLEFSKFELEN